MRLLRHLGRGAFALILALLPVVVADAGRAQTAPTAETFGIPEAELPGGAAPTSLDYTAWEATAKRTEDTIGNFRVTSDTLVTLRQQLVDWRSALLVAQNTNASRIATLRDQIAVLGPPPAEGETEPEEIAERRQTLSDQLVRLQAPRIAAEEAYRRADGLIREIDRVLRERQADQLLQLWPAPINPANWPEAVIALSDVVLRVFDEVGEGWQDRRLRDDFQGSLPLIALLIAIATLLLWRGRRWIEQLAGWLESGTSMRGHEALSFLASLGQIIVPTLGVLLLSVALITTGLLGEVGRSIMTGLPTAAFATFAGAWLGGRVFPAQDAAANAQWLGTDRRAAGRYLATTLGLLLGVEHLRNEVISPIGYSDAAVGVLALPLLALTAIVLFRLGVLLVQREGTEDGGSVSASASYARRLIRLMGRGLAVIAIAAIVLGAVGYVIAATSILFSTVMSLGLVALVVILQRLIGTIYGAIVGDAKAAEEALVPVIAGFFLSLAAVPLLALIWGARVDEITEIWSRFREGFTIGQTRISPADFLTFAVIFALGYALTRFVQGTLKASILPRTRLDQGGRNSVAAGVGYVGIFLSALIAINATGIDLSGLAIVAGALSVGIGFGLQNIVQNFVSGIILLIERPIGEGDWIEVGGVQGIVKSISVRSTRIQTFDRSDVIVPNADLVSGQVTNWTRFSLSGRLIVQVGVDYGSDTRKVERVLREIAEAQPLAVLNPPPLIVFTGLGADALNFEIRMILRDVNFSLTVRSEINHEIIRRFHEEGIAMPFSQRDIWLRNPEAVAEALRPLSRRAGDQGPGGAASTPDVGDPA